MTHAASTPAFAYQSVDEALGALREHLTPVEAETIPTDHAAGRVLAQTVATDRPSPACDVSAMDGYAVRTEDLSQSTLPVPAESLPGQAPPDMPNGAAVKIVTGAPVPSGADAVIPRERIEEHAASIQLSEDLNVTPGQHIRRKGENAPADLPLLQPGSPLTPPACAAASAFGLDQLRVHRKLRLSAIITGNEVLTLGSNPQPWQLRDSNGPTLHAMFAHLPWIDWLSTAHTTDDPQTLRDTCHHALEQSDALLLTGAVSMGDHDHVPDTLRELGCNIVFHKLPIRPGKPVLAAVGPNGQLVVGLPGNPVSVMITARRIAAVAMRHRSGFTTTEMPTHVTLTNPDDKTLHLHWSRHVRLTSAGQAELIHTRGSGDIVSTAASHGFVTIPPGQCGPGPWPYYPWHIGA